MLLPDLQLPPVIDSSSADMAREFIVPALAASVRYDRGVGFFSSGWLRMVSEGMGCRLFVNWAVMFTVS